MDRVDEQHAISEVPGEPLDEGSWDDLRDGERGQSGLGEVNGERTEPRRERAAQSGFVARDPWKRLPQWCLAAPECGSLRAGPCERRLGAMSEEPKNVVFLRRFAWANVVYTLLVILWGAWVRVSFSGDGCGDHWPLCQGRVMPTSGGTELWVELTHRITSALCGVIAIAFVVLARRAFAPGHPARRAAVVTLVFVLVEGLLGAALVKLRLVAHDTSIERAYVMALHLCNTFALLSACVAVAERSRVEPPRHRVDRKHLVELGVGFLALLLVGTTGAVTALGDTLFPSQGFRAGFVADFDPSSHPFLQLRAFHPIFALATSAFLVYTGASRLTVSPPELRRGYLLLLGVVVIQVGTGFANMLLGAPASLQIIHLLFADSIWVLLTYLLLASGRHGSIATSTPESPAADSSS